MEHCISKYAEYAPGNYELDLVVEHNHPTCGHGWQAALPRIQGQYVHFTCDDIEPHPGWAQPAIEATDKGFLPAPQVYSQDGAPQSHPRWGMVGTDWEPVYMTALPFVSRVQLESIAPLFTSHYFSDDFFSYRGNRAGFPTRLRVKYAFTHWWAAHARGAGMEYQQRLNYDQILFNQAMRMVENEQWVGPWPPVEIARPSK